MARSQRRAGSPGSWAIDAGPDFAGIGFARGGLSHRRFGHEVRAYAEVGSTNDLALAAGKAGALEGLVIVTEVQTAGRGRVHRRWEAPAGTSLLTSLLFRPAEPFAYYASRATMICGLALREAVVALSGVPVCLKWPNDLIVVGEGRRWRKVAGMLSEIGLDPAGRPEVLVVGMGVNVNIAQEDLPLLASNATSLLAERGAPVDRASLLQRLLSGVELHYEALANDVDPLPAWRDALAWLGQPVEVRGPCETQVGVAAGVDDDGALLLRTSDGRVRHVTAGDVSLRPSTGV